MIKIIKVTGHKSLSHKKNKLFHSKQQLHAFYKKDIKQLKKEGFKIKEVNLDESFHNCYW